MNSIGLLAAADAGGKASNPILPVWNEIIWGGAAFAILFIVMAKFAYPCLLYTSPSPRDATLSRMPSSA